MTQPSALILLHPADNVMVLRRHIQSGDQMLIDGQAVISPQTVEVGHKLARQDLGAGTIVLKYGAPIGSLTRDVKQGEHVHMHNMKSDYIPSHTRKASGNERG